MNISAKLISSIVATLLVSACTTLNKGADSAKPVSAAPKPSLPAPPSLNAGSGAVATPSVPNAANANAAAAAAAFASAFGAPGEPRKYEDVVTKDAKTSRGMLIHHKIKDRHLFEIPEKMLGRELLWSVELSQVSAGGGFNGLPLGYRVLRFERVDNRILLRSVSYQNRGLNDLKAATDAVDLAPIVMSFPVEAEGNEYSVELRAEEKRLLEKERADKEKLAKEKTAAEKKGIPGTAALEAVDDVLPVEKATDKPLVPGFNVATNVAATAAVNDKDKRTAPKEQKELKEPKEKWPVIDVSRLLMATSGDLIDGRNLGSQGFGAIDPTRSMVSQVKVFPQNIEARASLTYATFPSSQFGAQGAPPVARNPTKSAVVHYSIALLPETPMQGRFFDERVGYFTEPFLEFGGERSGVREREYITRFRLEKKDPAAAVSEVVKPITFYIAREVPEKWRKPLITGIEAWQLVFEAAGYKNAIVAKLAPTKEEDPSWDAEDARYSVIRWVALPIANAMGPHVHDPRSGEIISAHVIFWHDLLASLERSYFVQAGAADKRVDKFPLSDEIMSELVQSVATHEVGHTLGLRHNHRAATAYSVKDLRDPAFMATHGTNASIMSYGRFNSVAQPQDGVTSFVPKVGPYDYFAIDWGYRLLDKKSADEEIPVLDKMAARQITEPLLKFGGEDMAAFFDPEVQTENIGRERIEATKLSIASLERAATRLINATTRLGEDYDVLESTYYQLLGQRNRYVNSVVKLIGGVRETRYLGGRGGDTFVRTTPQEQRAAIRYLLDDALVTPKWLADPAVLNRIASFDVARPIVESQKNILGSMLLPIRFRVLEDAEMLKSGSGMVASNYLFTVQRSVFREAGNAQPKVDIYRRELQREYVEHLKAFSGEIQRFKSFGTFLSGVLADYSIDLRPAAIQGLKDLRRDLQSAESRAADTPTRLHFAQLSREIEKILKVRGS